MLGWDAEADGHILIGVKIGKQWLGPRIWVKMSLNDPWLTSLGQSL